MSRTYAGNNLYSPPLVISASGTTVAAQFDARVFDEAVYQITVESVTGAPTSWSLIPVFRQIMPRTLAAAEGALNAMDNGQLLPDGDWPVFSSAQVTNGILPLLFPVTRRIRGGFIHRLALVAVLTGGTAPTLVVSVNGPNLRG
jgi:hypothetical protein